MSKTIVVLSFLFPTDRQPIAGVFIRERVLGVGENLKSIVISPQPWSPLDSFVRFVKFPTYRLQPIVRDTVERGSKIFRPKFLSWPMIGRLNDSQQMAKEVEKIISQKVTDKVALIDAHFVYPDGHAAMLVAQKIAVPYTITLRGERDSICENGPKHDHASAALRGAAHVFCVSDDLRAFALRMGVESAKTSTVANGVNLDSFYPEDKAQARERLKLNPSDKFLISVGSLSERKGHHRVLESMPELIKSFPNLKLLIVGGPTSGEDMTRELLNRASALLVNTHIQMCGLATAEELRWYFSASDLFVLATAHEGRANVMNEALACGLPIVTTDVGGNREIVDDPSKGEVVKYWDQAAFVQACTRYLINPLAVEPRLDYARGLTWSKSVAKVVEKFKELI